MVYTINFVKAGLNSVLDMKDVVFIMHDSRTTLYAISKLLISKYVINVS